MLADLLREKSDQEFVNKFKSWYHVKNDLGNRDILSDGEHNGINTRINAKNNTGINFT